MDRFSRVELKMIAAMVKDWCANNDKLIFKPKICKGEDCIRFVTPFVENAFPKEKVKGGVAKSGYFVMYEIYNKEDDFFVVFSVSYKGFNEDKIKECQKLLEYFNVELDRPVSRGECLYFVKQWNYSEAAKSSVEILHAVESFVNNDLPVFEEELKVYLDGGSSAKAKEKTIVLSDTYELDPALKAIVSDKYENNPSAKKICLESNGTECTICGFDYAIEMGAEFANCMEVHHIVHPYMMRENYELDPVKHLIPVCPNCHRLLHSKKDGIYSVDEIKAIKDAKLGK